MPINREMDKEDMVGTSLVIQWLRVCLPCQHRGHGFSPWLERIPHAMEQRSLCATSAESQAPRARALQQEKYHNEKHGDSTCSQLEKA